MVIFMGMEIERKFLVKKLPDNLEQYEYRQIEQAYLNTTPVVRIRRSDEDYYLTYKGNGLMAREEYNLPLDAESYQHLLEKADGHPITKKRYLIPLSSREINEECQCLLNGASLTIELDVFEGALAPLVLAEIEFPSREAARVYRMDTRFSRDVTENPDYHNSNMIYL